MAEKKPRPVEYFDPEGKTQTGYFLDDHVYVDEQATQPIPAGSTFRAGNGNYYRMTPYGGVLWSSAKQVDEQGNWINQGSQWYVRAQDLMGQIQNRAPFAYDAATDPLYLQARGETVRQGRRAMEDAQALTAQLTGGYDSSYSRQVGEQAFHEHLSRLANLLPELYDRAKDGYDDETRALYDQVDGLLGLYDLDYQTYLSYQPNKRWKLDFIGYISDNHYNFEPEDRETKFGTMENVKSFRVYFDGQEKDRFLTYFGTLGITRQFTANTSLSLLGSAFYTKEQEKYDIQGQYWLDETETSENLGVGTYFEHARNYLTARVMSAKLMLKHKVKKHQIEGAVSLKREHIEENSVEYEMRDSAGYSIPHNGKDLYMVYSLKARNELNANRMEAYIQDTYRFSGGRADSTGNGQTHYTLNYGIRMSHWNFNRETIVSPRLSLAIIPANHENTTLRFAAGLYYQAPFFKELRDTSTVNGITIASLNEKIKSQRSIHFIAGYDYRFKLGDQRYKFSAEAYYKALDNLVPYSVSNVKVVYYGQNKCSGHAAGLDFKLYGEFVPGTDSWLSLSLMDTKMKLGGKSIPLPTDQRYAVNLFFTDYFPGSKKWRMSLKLAFADGLPFAAPHRELETNSFRATAYRRADIGMSYQLLDNSRREKKTFLKNVMLGIDCLNLFGIDNVNSYYWVTDVTSQQYAVPNYLTGRQLNARILLEF